MIDGVNQKPNLNCRIVTNRFQPLFNYFKASGYERTIELLTTSGECVRKIIVGNYETDDGRNLLLINTDKSAVKKFVLRLKGRMSARVVMESGEIIVPVKIEERDTYITLKLKPGEYITLCAKRISAVKEEESAEKQACFRKNLLSDYAAVSQTKIILLSIKRIVVLTGISGCTLSTRSEERRPDINSLP